MPDDHRAVLEAILFGDDQRVTPSDRLRALEHLSRLDDTQAPNAVYSSELAALEGEELDRHLDALLAEQIAADVFGDRERWPTLAHLVDRELENRAETLAQDLHVAQVEAEIERRVEERVCQLAAATSKNELAAEPLGAHDRTPPGVVASFPSRPSWVPSESVFRNRPRVA